MKTSNDSIIGIVVAEIAVILLSLFSDIVDFGINYIIAKFIIAPLIGAQVCFALNTVFNTVVFNKDILPVLYATASFVGRILFKSKLKVEKD